MLVVSASVVDETYPATAKFSIVLMSALSKYDVDIYVRVPSPRVVLRSDASKYDVDT